MDDFRVVFPLSMITGTEKDRACGRPRARKIHKSIEINITIVNLNVYFILALPAMIYTTADNCPSVASHNKSTHTREYIIKVGMLMLSSSYNEF